jgi:hypothetical protein
MVLTFGKGHSFEARVDGAVIPGPDCAGAHNFEGTGTKVAGWTFDLWIVAPLIVSALLFASGRGSPAYSFALPRQALAAKCSLVHSG